MQVPAKINLYLHVTGKRNDGYHTLDSLMVNINICDVIEVEQASEISLTVNGTFAKPASAQDNIIIKAANLLKKSAGLKEAGANIKLQKNIPVGAGLGGGSADAAAALKLLNDLWNINYSLDKLLEIGLQLGADVPFFLTDGAAYVSGIGEKIDKINQIPSLNILLVNPSKSLLTRDVFTYAPIKQSGAINKTGDFFSIIKEAGNDLQENAIALMPEIDAVLTSISQQKNCLVARMSGSGSTCFGLFESENDMVKAENIIKRQNSGWWVKPVKSI